jgi:hypothetical protein
MRRGMQTCALAALVACGGATASSLEGAPDDSGGVDAGADGQVLEDAKPESGPASDGAPPDVDPGIESGLPVEDGALDDSPVIGSHDATSADVAGKDAGTGCSCEATPFLQAGGALETICPDYRNETIVVTCPTVATCAPSNLPACSSVTPPADCFAGDYALSSGYEGVYCYPAGL